MKPHRAVLLVSVGCFVDAIGRAQPPSDLTIQVGECIALESTAERHACFDRQVEAALKDAGGGVEPEATAAGTETEATPRSTEAAPAPAPPATAAPEPAAPASASTSAEPAGSDAPVATDTAESPPPEPIVGSITALTQLRPNQFLIELENGQTWRQVTTQRYALRVGREVTIYATRWGDTYRLQTADASDFIQVERVR
jgi:hypothetical protein